MPQTYARETFGNVVDLSMNWSDTSGVHSDGEHGGTYPVSLIIADLRFKTGGPVDPCVTVGKDAGIQSHSPGLSMIHPKQSELFSLVNLGRLAGLEV